MEKNKKDKLVKAGWKFGDYATFLNLSEQEKEAVEKSIQNGETQNMNDTKSTEDLKNDIKASLESINDLVFEAFDFLKNNRYEAVDDCFLDIQGEMKKARNNLNTIFENEGYI